MKPVLTAIALLLLPGLGAAQGLALFPTPGTPYDEARRALLDGGWQPVVVPEAQRCAPGDGRCEGRPEMVDCQSTGLAQCAFVWQQGPILIEIITTGDPPAVAGFIPRRRPRPAP
jgi:hypothetical protein